MRQAVVLLLLLLASAAGQQTTAAVGSAPSEQQQQSECGWSGEQGGTPAKTSMSALVLGGTGAIGHHIVEQLLASDQWSKVVAVGRREVRLPPGQAGAPKLRQVVVDMDRLESEAGREFAGVDAVFCALGTTRSDAGSAEVFKKVDLEYVAAAARAARAAGVPYFGLVSAQGANPAVPASDFKLLHPLLYTRTKGLAEEAVKSQGFARAAIFRPGFLNRGDRARAIERVFAPVLGSIPVADVARVMIADAAAFRAAAAAGASGKEQGPRHGVGVFEMASLKAAAAAGGPPQ